MKQKLTFLVLFLGITYWNAHTQNISKSIHFSQLSYGTQIIPVENNLWLIGMTYGSTNPYATVYSGGARLIDSTGQFLNFVGTGATPEDSRIRGVKDIGYDPVSHNYYSIIEAYICETRFSDLIVMSNPSDTTYWVYEWENASKLLVLPGEGVLVADKVTGHILNLSLSGELNQNIDPLVNGLFRPLDMTSRSNNSIFAIAHGYLVEMDETGNTSNIAPTQSGIAIDYMSFDQSLFVLTNDEIIKYDTFYNQIHEHSLSGVGRFYKMAVADSLCFLLGYDHQNQEPIIQVFDHTLEPLSQIFIGGKNIVPYGIAARNGEVTVIGDEVPEPFTLYDPGTILEKVSLYKGSSLLTKSFSYAGEGPADLPDISLTDLQIVGNNPISLAGNCPLSGGQQANLNIENLKVTVKNNGSVPIDEFWLNARFELCSDTCKRAFYKETYYAAQYLAPGGDQGS